MKQADIRVPRQSLGLRSLGHFTDISQYACNSPGITWHERGGHMITRRVFLKLNAAGVANLVLTSCGSLDSDTSAPPAPPASLDAKSIAKYQAALVAEGAQLYLINEA